MPGVIENTQSLIESLKLFDDRRVLLTGRGATALCVLYRALAPLGGRVILPSIGCPSLLATAMFSGLEPVIVDVDRNLNIDPGKVDEVIREGDLVIGIHIFGIPCDVEKLEEICNRNGAIFIEDAAQSIGGYIADRQIGTFGKASILSFAGGKILPTNGGGAILIDDPKLYGLVSEEISKLPERPNNLALSASLLRDKLSDAFNMARMDDPGKASVWYDEYKFAGDIYNYSISDEEALKISDEIKKLGNIRDTRTNGVGIYREQLDFDSVECLDYPDKCCPYRFSFILSELTGTEVQNITNEIRAGGMHASNLYLPLHWLAPGHVTVGECPNAEHAGIRIINLWLTDGIPERDAPRVRDIVVKWVNR